MQRKLSIHMLISCEQNTGQGSIIASGQEINPVKGGKGQIFGNNWNKPKLNV
jgi:hypothetical protein